MWMSIVCHLKMHTVLSTLRGKLYVILTVLIFSCKIALINRFKLYLIKTYSKTPKKTIRLDLVNVTWRHPGWHYNVSRGGSRGVTNGSTYPGRRRSGRRSSVRRWASAWAKERARRSLAHQRHGPSYRALVPTPSAPRAPGPAATASARVSSSAGTETGPAHRPTDHTSTTAQHRLHSHALLHEFFWIHTYTSLTALCPGLPGWAGTRKVKPIWILLKQKTVSGSCISRAICKSAPHSRQITMPAPHHSVFYRPDALPAAQQTASKHWKHYALSAFFETEKI